MFESWMNLRKIKGIDENVVLAYFLHLQKKLAPSSLWTKYSMLRSTIHLYKKNRHFKIWQTNELFEKQITGIQTKEVQDIRTI